jgi:hypothetical protein
MIERRLMKRVYLTIVYLVLTIAALVLASGAPVAFSGTGGGG